MPLYALLYHNVVKIPATNVNLPKILNFFNGSNMRILFPRQYLQLTLVDQISENPHAQCSASPLAQHESSYI